uniref:Uncharacterized protein n=1 Tax=Panagrellus redivivus TaxID=6233 RepID=A0A7E4UW80_PANRE
MQNGFVHLSITDLNPGASDSDSGVRGGVGGGFCKNALHCLNLRRILFSDTSLASTFFAFCSIEASCCPLLKIASMTYHVSSTSLKMVLLTTTVSRLQRPITSRSPQEEGSRCRHETRRWAPYSRRTRPMTTIPRCRVHCPAPRDGFHFGNRIIGGVESIPIDLAVPIVFWPRRIQHNGFSLADRVLAKNNPSLWTQPRRTRRGSAECKFV